MFETWDGETAAAARSSVGRTRVDFDSHGTHVAAIAAAAQTAVTEVETVKAKLVELRADTQQQGFSIGGDGVVRQTITTVVTREGAERLAAQREALQLRVNQLLINAQLVDSDLANAIKAADGELNSAQVAAASHAPQYAEVFGISSLGLPNYPEHSLSDVEARNYYIEGENRLRVLNEELAKSDLSLEERTKIAQEIRNELRTQARDLMSDRVRAADLFETRAEPVDGRTD